jgi:hypothetical protein
VTRDELSVSGDESEGGLFGDDKTAKQRSVSRVPYLLCMSRNEFIPLDRLCVPLSVWMAAHVCVKCVYTFE